MSMEGIYTLLKTHILFNVSAQGTALA